MRLILNLLIIILFTSCGQKQLQVKIIEDGILPHPPSASGITINKHGIFAIGDNVNYLYLLNNQLKMISKQPLTQLEEDTFGIIPKMIKPDFEAIESLEDQNSMLIFGSGSISPTRDMLIQVDLDANNINTYSLTPFYQKLKNTEELKNKELNIEALAIHADEMYLFNRGSNHIIEFSVKAFFSALKQNTAFPTPKFYKIELPLLNGNQASFSGATIHNDSKTILFTASVESTPNAIDDGEILGSFVGILPIAKLKNGAKPKCKTLIINNNTLKTKVESITIFDVISMHKMIVYLVSDSDGGQSAFFKVLLEW